MMLPPPMKRLTSSGVWISTASAKGLAGLNGLIGQAPSATRVLSFTNAGVNDSTLYGLIPMLSFPVMPRRVSSWM